VRELSEAELDALIDEAIVAVCVRGEYRQAIPGP
jgi:hypothetical protein